MFQDVEEGKSFMPALVRVGCVEYCVLPISAQVLKQILQTVFSGLNSMNLGQQK
jgi:hypothetical protein